MHHEEKKVAEKLLKGMLDLVLLTFINAEPMHGYQIIQRIRRAFGTYLGPSTIYPLLNCLESKGYINSEWDMCGERPRKVYSITQAGRRLLSFSEETLRLILKHIGITEHPGVLIAYQEASKTI